MKRKIVSALLVMSMTASLVACGNSGSGSSDPADESVSVSSSASSESDARRFPGGHLKGNQGADA